MVVVLLLLYFALYFSTWNEERILVLGKQNNGINGPTHYKQADGYTQKPIHRHVTVLTLIT